jgi:protein-L-isoaspartate(D-aspartate) O-methyltransferase
MDMERARHNMIESQVRTWEVLDERVLQALAEVPRERFVPEENRAWAYIDYPVPIGHGAEMLSPMIQARFLQELRLEGDDRVLEVGTGTGYMTALMAKLAGEVYSVDLVPSFKLEAEARLRELGLDGNVKVETGDAAEGWPRQAPYDAILISGAMPEVPEAFKEELAVGGRLIVVVDRAEPVQEALRITRVSEEAFRQESLFETEIPHLRGAAERKRFVF